MTKEGKKKKVMSRTRNQRRHQVDVTEEEIEDDILDVKIAIDVARHASLAAERAVAEQSAHVRFLDPRGAA